jgi:transposase
MCYEEASSFAEEVRMSSAKIRYAQRDQVELQTLSLDGLIPEDHRVRDVWAYVEELDVTDLVSKIRSLRGEAGAPSFDPRTLLTLWLYATLEGVGSARRLAQLCQESLVYRWITGGDAINYHTLSSFRTQNVEALDRLLIGSVAALAAEGFVDLDRLTVAQDGLRVRASAGRDSMHRRPTLEKALEQARAHVERLKSAPPEDPPRARQGAARGRAARERVGRLEEALKVMEKMEARQRKRTDRKPREPRVSSTDPSAAMLRMANGGKDPAHNIQFTVETSSRIVTSVRTTDMSSDTGTLRQAMEDHQRSHGALPHCVLADQGFFKYSDIAALERQGCEVLLPDLYPKARRRAQVPAPDALYIARWKERIETDAARKTYKLRGSTVEWANAQARQQGLQRLTVRGRLKVRAIGLWHALCHNMRRTLALRAQRLLAREA